MAGDGGGGAGQGHIADDEDDVGALAKGGSAMGSGSGVCLTKSQVCPSDEEVDELLVGV